MFVVGKGRSGTTWVGRLLDTFPHCLYKHEPFLHLKRNAYTRWLNLDINDLTLQETRNRFSSVYRSCLHDVDMPPFFNKSFYNRNRIVLRALFTLGKVSSLCRSIYETYGTLKVSETPTDVVIKEVNLHIRQIVKLDRILQPHWVLMIRTPYGNIASYLRGIRLGLFPGPCEADKTSLRNAVESSEDVTLREWGPTLNELSTAGFEALRWRVEVEPILDYIAKHERSYLLIYERFCVDPLSELAKLFVFLGWDMHTDTHAYLARTVSKPLPTLGMRRTYYGTHRDPLEVANRWRKDLSPRDVEDISEVVCQSPAAQLWDGLDGPEIN